MVPAKCHRFCCNPFLLQIFLRKMMEITLKKLDAQAVEISVSIAPFAEFFQLTSKSFKLIEIQSPSFKLTVKPRQGGNKNIIKKVTLDPAKLCLDFLPFTTHPLHRVKVETLRVSLFFNVIMSGIQHFFKIIQWKYHFNIWKKQSVARNQLRAAKSDV